MKAIECPKVGEIMTAKDGTMYLTVAERIGAGCSDCDLRGPDNHCDRLNITGLGNLSCSSGNRPDKTDVTYRRIDKIVEEL